MNQPTIFDFKGNQIRTIWKNEQPWLVAKDVCAVLGLANHSDAISRLSPSMKSVLGVTDPHGRVQDTAMVSEAGMYKLIFRSNKPEAESFGDWVASDVLPSIRKHGMYARDELLDNPDLLLDVVTKLREERALRQIAEQQIVVDKPKVIFADAVAASSTSILIGELAKILKQNGVNTGQNRLFQWLRDKGYLIVRHGSDFNMPTQRSMELGLFEIKETSITHSDGHITISKTTKVTGKGQVYFVNKIKGALTA